MTHITSGDFQSLKAGIRVVRDAVFIGEQGISHELEIDGQDESCTHVLVLVDDQSVGTARMTAVGKVGRVAVLKAFRNRGIGRMIMQALEGIATAAGLTRIYFHAQTSAVPFYLESGYKLTGTEFMEAGIPHVAMEKPLPHRQ